MMPLAQRIKLRAKPYKGEPDMITLNLTNEEANALGALLDAAVKATGIQGAKAAVVLFEKLEQAAKASQTVEPTE